MTTDIRTARSRPRAGDRATNFHEASALDHYGRHFQQIGIASVAAAAAQVKPAPKAMAQDLFDLPPHLREDADAA